MHRLPLPHAGEPRERSHPARRELLGGSTAFLNPACIIRQPADHAATKPQRKSCAVCRIKRLVSNLK